MTVTDNDNRLTDDDRDRVCDAIGDAWTLGTATDPEHLARIGANAIGCGLHTDLTHAEREQIMGYARAMAATTDGDRYVRSDGAGYVEAATDDTGKRYWRPHTYQADGQPFRRWDERRYSRAIRVAGEPADTTPTNHGRVAR